MCQTEKKHKYIGNVVSNIPIATDVYKMVIHIPEIVNCAKVGQFVNIYCKDQSLLLPRPISISEIVVETGELVLVYAVVGKGTKEFADYAAGDTISLLGPLGNGFNIQPGLAIIVGGGVGTPPMVELAKQHTGEKIIVVGFRTEPYLIEELSRFGQVHIATDDGSVGTKGTVMNILNQMAVSEGTLYACGPLPMLKALQSFVETKGIKGQLSLEERMGCGIGGCVGCVCKIKKAEGFIYKKVCVDGPVFNAEEVLFQ